MHINVEYPDVVIDIREIKACIDAGDNVGRILEDYLDTFAGIVINPGDIIVGDSDGLLAIKPDEHTAELAEIARNYHAGEEKQLEGILTRGEWPRPWVDEALNKVGFEFVD